MTTTTLAAQMPQTIGAAFAHINQITAPTIDDLKVMVLVEAASEELYCRTAATTDNPAVADLLRHNGHEEMKHAHRVAEAIGLLGGGAFPPPARDANPYLTGVAGGVGELTPETLRKLAETEFAGDALYETWAASMSNPAAAALFRANGKEETDHGNRLLQAAALLEG